MVHPQMFDDDDPLLALVRSIALAVPGSHEKISHGRPAFHTVKVHCYYGGARKVEGEWEQHPQSVLLHLPASESAAVQEYSASFVPAYLGGSGWIGLDLDERTDPAEPRGASSRSPIARWLRGAWWPRLDSDARPSA